MAQRMWSTVLLTLVALVALSSVADAATCYVCNSGENPLGCGQSSFVAAGIQQKTGCTCCTKSSNQGGVVIRDCVQGFPIQCFPTLTNSVCGNDLCNSASGLNYHVIVVLATIAIGVFVNLH